MGLLFIAIGISIFLFIPKMAKFSTYPVFTKWFAQIFGIIFALFATISTLILIWVYSGLIHST
jgi:hypothetical protein